ncbi:hypothetical protein BJ170DRAFT_185374 [Xylariales sp. AK1849]|nr:hypothetical protein BJ170DRAFT_185374 [Xylariales sp. AK1849]
MNRVAMLSMKQSLRPRQIVLICVGFLALYFFLLIPNVGPDSSRTVLNVFPGHSKSAGGELPAELLNNRFLAADECAATFPKLTKEIDNAVAKGRFTLKKSGLLGPLIARIKDGKLSILQYTSKNDLSRDMLAHRIATLHQIHTAILTSPSPREIPDTIFAFNHHDDPSPSTFSYSRPADPARNSPSKHYFTVPHFSHWSWPLAFIGSLPRASAAIAALESTVTWSEKIPQAIWRGTPHFNSASTTSGRLRQDLILSAQGKAWADVEALHWSGGGGTNASNALPIEDFCRYRYIIHTEGVTYSGRFQFHQLCASVVLTPPVSWMQTTTHLVKPVFSSTLPGVERVPRSDTETGSGVKEKITLAPYPSSWVRDAWGRGHKAEEANIVFVAPDWSDLESTILWLENHPEIAEGIARRQRETFHRGGYLSPAAEMCYWRAAIRGWSEGVRYDGQGFEEMEGMPFEEFSLTEAHK